MARVFNDERIKQISDRDPPSNFQVYNIPGNLHRAVYAWSIHSWEQMQDCIHFQKRLTFSLHTPSLFFSAKRNKERRRRETREGRAEEGPDGARAINEVRKWGTCATRRLHLTIYLRRGRARDVSGIARWVKGGFVTYFSPREAPEKEVCEMETADGRNFCQFDGG